MYNKRVNIEIFNKAIVKDYHSLNNTSGILRYFGWYGVAICIISEKKAEDRKVYSWKDYKAACEY